MGLGFGGSGRENFRGVGVFVLSGRRGLGISKCFEVTVTERRVTPGLSTRIIYIYIYIYYLYIYYPLKHGLNFVTATQEKYPLLR